jgi:UDP-GlcNAc3NAcA epimerase
MKVLTIVGARPQFVKAAVVSRAFSKCAPQTEEIIVHTGQHYDANMSDVFFSELGIPKPHINLGIGGGTHGQNTGRMLESLDQIVREEKPDWVLVYGDTDSTLAGALAAAKLHVPVAHVEAGLRSFNRRMPEEVNRVLTDHVSNMLFAPTRSAVENLRKEGISTDIILLTGDVMYDAALYYRERAKAPVWFKNGKINENGFILCTLHRAENTDDESRLKSIITGLGLTEFPVVLPLHPRTRGVIDRAGILIPTNLLVVDPVGYLEMIWLEIHCKAIATDSGGVQKEAYFHRKPCITLRDETEWTELVEHGYNRLVGSDSQLIAAELNTSKFPTFKSDLYGEGHSAEMIVKLLS